MKTAIATVITIALGLIYSLSQAATLSTLWGWYLQPQYGSGPTYPSWFGISMIVSVIGMGMLSRVKHEQVKGLADNVAIVIGLHLALGIALAVAWCIGQLFGWL